VGPTRRSTERGHRIGDPRLREGDHVHVPFDEDQSIELAYGPTRLIEAVEFAPFVKNGRLRRVEVLRLLVTEHPSTEPDHAPADVPDREHDPIAEAVVLAARLAFDDETRSEEFGVLEITERAHEVVPTRGCKSDAEVARNDSGDATTLQVVHRARGVGVRAQRPSIELLGRRERLVGASVGLRVLSSPLLARHFHACDGRKRLDRGHEVEPVVLHQELQRGPRRPASEAVVELPIGHDVEGRRLLVVKRTEAEVATARLLQRQARLDHVDDVDTGEQVVDESLGNQTGHG
jgi:hypothetical protein